MTSVSRDLPGRGDRKPDRGRKRREKTRASLIAAARVVVARKGAEATTIQEITDEADVGFGTFYNHFESKEAMLDEVVQLLIGEFLDSIEALTSEVEDPAIAVATVVTNFGRLLDVDPVLCGLAVRIGLLRPELGNAVAGRLRDDLERGCQSGRFSIPDMRAALVILGGAIYFSMMLRLGERLEADDETNIVEMLLAMLGLSAEESRRIAAGPLPLLPPVAKEE
jgi:AcrR family transcriptional regulator